MAIFMLMDPHRRHRRLLGAHYSRIDQVQITHHSGFPSGHDRVNRHGAGPGHIGLWIKGLCRGTSTWDWPYFHNDPQQENASQMERCSLNQAPTWTVPPLDTNNQLVQTPATGSSLPRPPGLAHSRQACNAWPQHSCQEGSHHWVPMQDLPFNEVILFGYAADHSSRPTYVCLPPVFYHARSGRVLQQSGPNQEVTPLPGIYFSMDGESEPAWRSQQTYPNRGTTRTWCSAPSGTATESSQTPDEKARDILAKALRNQAEDGPSTQRTAIQAYKYLYALVQQHGPQCKHTCPVCGQTHPHSKVQTLIKWGVKFKKRYALA